MAVQDCPRLNPLNWIHQVQRRPLDILTAPESVAALLVGLQPFGGTNMLARQRLQGVAASSDAIQRCLARSLPPMSRDTQRQA